MARQVRGYVPNQTAFILIVYQIQSIACPNLFHLLDVFLQRHLSLRLNNDLLDLRLVSLEIEVIHMAQRHPDESIRGKFMETYKVLLTKIAWVVKVALVT